MLVRRRAIDTCPAYVPAPFGSVANPPIAVLLGHVVACVASSEARTMVRGLSGVRRCFTWLIAKLLQGSRAPYADKIASNPLSRKLPPSLDVT